MGQLKPDTTYIYERVGDTVFRRESGATDREVVGYGARMNDGRLLVDHIQEEKLWGQIRQAARTNPALQDVLERAIMIYRLSKTT